MVNLNTYIHTQVYCICLLLCLLLAEHDQEECHRFERGRNLRRLVKDSMGVNGKTSGMGKNQPEKIRNKENQQR